MTPQQLKAMKLALEALTIQSDRVTEIGKKREAITAIEEVLAEHAMQEVQRLGQEPLEYWNAVEGWVKIDEVREHFDSVGCATIYKTAGEGRVPLSLAKAQPEQEPVACERCKQLEEQAYDLVGELRVANIKLSMRPQRKPLTHKEIWNAIRPLTQSDAVCMSLVQISMDEYRAIEAAHGIKGEA